MRSLARKPDELRAGAANRNQRTAGNPCRPYSRCPRRQVTGQSGPRRPSQLASTRFSRSWRNDYGVGGKPSDRPASARASLALELLSALASAAMTSPLAWASAEADDPASATAMSLSVFTDVEDCASDSPIAEVSAPVIEATALAPATALPPVSPADVATSAEAAVAVDGASVSSEMSTTVFVFDRAPDLAIVGAPRPSVCAVVRVLVRVSVVKVANVPWWL